jgi:hypothetical protein
VTETRRQIRRGFEAPLLALFGPLVGCLALMAFFLTFQLGKSFDSPVTRDLSASILFVGYFIGLFPAVCTALAYSWIARHTSSERSLPGLGMALGGMFGFLGGVFLMAPRGGFAPLPLPPFFALLPIESAVCGAVAAYVCVRLGRWTLPTETAHE